jgi:hypothetical protein
MLATNTPYAETQRHATPLGEKSAVGLCLRVDLRQAQFRRDDPPSSHEDLEPDNASFLLTGLASLCLPSTTWKPCARSDT